MRRTKDQKEIGDVLELARSVATAAKVEHSTPAEVIEAATAGNISLNLAALTLFKKQVARMRWPGYRCHWCLKTP